MEKHDKNLAPQVLATEHTRKSARNDNEINL